MLKKQIDNLNKISKMLGFNSEGLIEYLNWCLLEHLLYEIVILSKVKKNRNKPDAISLFKECVENRTSVKWDFENIRILYEKALQASEAHYRQQITYEEFLRLLINTPLKCSNPTCNKTPPDVVLHIDHIFPSSRGGTSKFENLRFLCAECNLKKSDKIERSNLWLKLESLRQN